MTSTARKLNRAKRNVMTAQILDAHDRDRVLLKQWIEDVASPDDVDALHAVMTTRRTDPNRPSVEARTRVVVARLQAFMDINH